MTSASPHPRDLLLLVGIVALLLGLGGVVISTVDFILEEYGKWTAYSASILGGTIMLLVWMNLERL